MFEPAPDRLGEDVGEIAEARDVAARDVDAERQRQAGFEEPPLAQVEHLVQAEVRERELPLVDQEAVVGAAGSNLVRDLLEGQLAKRDLAEREPERQERRCHGPRHDDLLAAQIVERRRLTGNDDRAVPRADARSVRKKNVVLLNERIGSERDRGDLEPGRARPLVQGLDIGEYLLEDEAPPVDEVGRQRPVHERVVGVGAVANADLHGATTVAPCSPRPEDEPRRVFGSCGGWSGA